MRIPIEIGVFEQYSKTGQDSAESHCLQLEIFIVILVPLEIESEDRARPNEVEVRFLCFEVHKRHDLFLLKEKGGGDARSSGELWTYLNLG